MSSCRATNAKADAAIAVARAMSEQARRGFLGSSDEPDTMLTLASAWLLAASVWEVNDPLTREEWIAKGPSIAVRCPAGTSFDAAEALRLELVDKLPAGVTVDVQIAPSEPGTLSPEDAAGELLFASERAERIAGPAPSLDDPYPWDEDEREQQAIADAVEGVIP